MATNNKSNNGALAAEIGAGLLAAAAAAGTGYYFYASEDAKKHRKVAAKWADAMKRDVIKEAKKAQAASPKVFAAIVDEAALAYVSAKKVRKEDAFRAAAELKRNWDKVRSEFQKAAKKAGAAKRAAKKPVAKAKKAVKKMVKKATKKARR